MTFTPPGEVRVSQPRLLDLFCGAGGACKGYQRAGFYVVGVDNRPQPRYCGEEFIQADALEYVKAHGHEYDAIHASPPCQAFSALRVMANARPHGDLLSPTRDHLENIGRPFIIENVEQAPMESGPPTLFSYLSGIRLCGSMFGLQTEKYQLRRHRLFEASEWLSQPICRHRDDLIVVGFYGDHVRTRTRVNGRHSRGTDITRGEDKLRLVRELMGIDWMVWTEANQAIPPAYTEFIGTQLLQALRSA